MMRKCQNRQRQGTGQLGRVGRSITGRIMRGRPLLLLPQFCRNSAILEGMKANVTITSRGVITLPAKMRQALGLKAEDHLIAETTPEGLLLRPAITLPVELYTPQRVREFDLAEQELAAYLGTKSTTGKRPARRKRKPSR